MKNVVGLFVGLLVSNVLLAQQVVFPLHLGDQWDYCGLTTAHVAADTMMPDGNKYSIIMGLPFLYTTRFLRQVGDSVFEYTGGSPGSRLAYDFTKHKGDTLYSIGTSDLICTYFSVDSLFGKKLRTWVFAFGPRGVADGSSGEMITDSIGITNVFYNGGMAEASMCSAKINGIQYGTITDIKNSIIPTPHAFSLSQNYPNPFNPTTIIRYELPEQSLVSLKVFNILGQEIATLVQEMQNPDIKLTNFNGNTVPNGVYYYTLRAVNKSNSFTQTHKMLLLK